MFTILLHSRAIPAPSVLSVRMVAYLHGYNPVVFAASTLSAAAEGIMSLGVEHICSVDAVPGADTDSSKRSY